MLLCWHHVRCQRMPRNRSIVVCTFEEVWVSYVFEFGGGSSEGKDFAISI